MRPRAVIETDRAVPVQYTWIPFPARALKTIANELISVRQDAAAAERADAASDDGVRTLLR